MSILTRKKTDCETHDWSSTVTAGLRRSICSACGTITLEPVSQELSSLGHAQGSSGGRSVSQVI